MKIDHLLVATDLSQEALSSCTPVADVARSVGARITLLHVLDTLEAIPHGSPLAPPLRKPGLTGDIEAARAQLEKSRGAFGPGIDVSLDVVSGEDAAQEIAEYADANNVDLIAISTHGRTGFRHLVLGSVAEGVVRHSRVPVLVFPRPKK